MQCKICNCGTLKVYSSDPEHDCENGDCTRIQYAQCDHCKAKSKIVVTKTVEATQITISGNNPLYKPQSHPIQS